MRRHNLSAVLRTVHQGGPASRARLTDALGLNRSTVGDLVGGLVEAGLVAEERPGALLTGRSVGRPSLVVRPLEEAACVVAASVDVHEVKVARVGLGGRVLARAAARPAVGAGPEEVVRRLARLVDDVLVTPAQRDGLVGLGVAVAGTVSPLDGTVGLAPNLGWSQVPLGEAVRTAVAARLGREVPVSVANDADLGVLAEHLRGAARGSADVVYLCGTHGLGGGIISGGHQLTGSHGYAGEVGHVGVDPDGRPCHCGSRGCWEAEACAPAWAEALDLDPAALDVAALVRERLAHGGVAARRTRDRLSRSFARGLATVVNIFDPDVVLLGAGLWRDLWPEVSGDVLPWLDRLVLPALREQLTVHLSGLGQDSTLLGASELAFTTLLDDPLGLAPAAPAPVAAVAAGDQT